MRISKNHPNRSLHNWLIYNIGDRFLKKYVHLYTGDLFDLGCGESPYRDFFLNYARSYTGVDWVDSYHNTSADIAADLNMPFPIESDVADCVVSLSVLEHLYEPQNMLNESFRILKPGGNLIIQVPWQWWIHEAPHDYFRYTPYGLRHMLGKAGFVDIDIDAQSGCFTTLFIKLNYFTRRFVRGPKVARLLILAALTPMWYLNQKLAPLLDKLDRNWFLESSGYYVLAKKPPIWKGSIDAIT